MNKFIADIKMNTVCVGFFKGVINLNIKEKIIDILIKVKPNIDWSNEELYSLPLTGGQLKFEAQDIVFLMLEVIDEFKIKLDKDDVIDYRFNSVNNIMEIVKGKL